MTNLEVFKNEEFGEVRTVLINNERLTLSEKMSH